MTERLINRRQQGDLGEASAIEWLTRQGATVSVPIGFSPDYDLLAELAGRILRVQVKTTTVCERTPGGQERWLVRVATNGGNQSWTGVAKHFEPERVDLLFALVGDGRRWLIPAAEIEATTTVTVGGPKFSEFEIRPSDSIDELVYGSEGSASRIGGQAGERRSRRAGPVCKIGALALSEFDSHLPHPRPERRRPAVGRTRISANHQVTLPKAPFEATGLRVGDLMRVEAQEDRSLLMRRIEPPGEQGSLAQDQ